MIKYGYFLRFTKCYSRILALLCIVIITASCNTGNSPGDENVDISVIPVPKSVILKDGVLTLTGEVNISARGQNLRQVANVLGENLTRISNNEIDFQKEGKNPAINLTINSKLAPSAYRIKINKSVNIEGGSERSIIAATYTLLQLADKKGNELYFPKLVIEDQPDSEYRGLLIDLARNWHDVGEILKLIDLSAFYRLNYIQLHFTDYQSFTLPSRSFPDISTPGRHYTFEDLSLINKYARERGIDIIPEMDIPGHSMAMIKAYPDLFGIRDIDKNPYTVNMGKEEVYDALEKLINETIDAFPESPYYHIGGDEAIFHMLDHDPDVIAYMEKNRLGNDIHELYRHFLVRMNDIIKARGKRMCIWEGFRKNGTIEIPKDILVFEYESAFYLPCDLINDGYTVVNASWKPLYVVNEKKWSPGYIYSWNIYRWENWFDKVPSFIPIQCEPSPQLIGGQMCAWEQKQEQEFPSLRQRLAAFSERIWNIEKVKTEEEFMSDLASTDELLSKLLNDTRQDTVPAFDK